MTLKNKHVVVTGGGSGVGEAIALKLAENSSLVTILGRRDKPLKQVSAKHKNINWRVCDVSSSEEVESCYNDIRSEYGNINIVIANAGIGGDVASIEEYEESRFDQVMEVNAKGPFLGLKAAIPAMTERGGGSFVITSSIAGVTGAALLSPYVMSKHAVVGLMKSASKECAPLNIRVNTVNPAPVETDMMRIIEEGMDSVSEEDDPKAKIQENIPLGRYAQPEEIAKLMLFLSSDDSSFITGSVYLADGGSTA